MMNQVNNVPISNNSYLFNNKAEFVISNSKNRFTVWPIYFLLIVMVGFVLFLLGSITNSAKSYSLLASCGTIILLCLIIYYNFCLNSNMDAIIRIIESPTSNINLEAVQNATEGKKVDDYMWDNSAIGWLGIIILLVASFVLFGLKIVDGMNKKLQGRLKYTLMTYIQSWPESYNYNIAMLHISLCFFCAMFRVIWIIRDSSIAYQKLLDALQTNGNMQQMPNQYGVPGQQFQPMPGTAPTQNTQYV